MIRKIILILLLIQYFTQIFAQENPPVIEIIEPVKNQIFQNDSIYIKVKATDEDQDITKVTISANDSMITTLDSEPYEFIWKNMTDGNYLIEARVYDQFGFQRYQKVRGY